MTLLTITFKDLIQSSRTWSAYIFMFVIPVMITLLFFVMFGGFGSGEAGFELPQTTMVIVNLDSGHFPAGMSFDAGIESDPSLDLTGAENMGGILTRLLQGESFADFIVASELPDESAARAAVDSQKAAVAIIIPANFTDAISGQDEVATVELYRDPTLTIGPAIIEGMLRQILDVFAANKIGISVAMEQLVKSGVPGSPTLAQDLFAEFTANSSVQGPVALGAGPDQIKVKKVSVAEDSKDLITQIVSVILAGMMIFFAFFTGSASIQTILIEEERGTLARLFTTPNSHRTILGGKTVAALITLMIQVTVLLLFGRYIFKIDWGDLLAVILAVAGLVIVSAATGLFLVSFLKNIRQAGIVFGGILTLTGMMGLLPVFTAGVPEQPEVVEKISLLVPQGWAMLAFTTAMDGGTALDVLAIFAVLMLWSLVFAVIAQYRLQKRFA